ncbi:hypothetical protein G6O67_005207 [Ophiocordyceps sinensis]|uniref:Uncharacterized protein n=1 Tax=Ophiocordyceps sinensis TaxID=72228 RepID=A0A8H4V5P0_9HYPO|nr:hypothetical protein G6O67_005207 [Ophiocordyceps sinensis]
MITTSNRQDEVAVTDIVSRADELCVEIDTECNELTSECAESLKVMIRGFRDGTANKSPGALQQAAHEFRYRIEAS